MRKNKKGQSTIEFLMTFSMVFGFFFLFFKMSVNYTDGFMVHYATFMASRAYMTVQPEKNTIEDADNTAKDHAKMIFKKYLPSSVFKNFDGEIFENNPSQMKYYPFVGMYSKYTTKFSLGMIGGSERIEMRSESFLGREPARVEVYTQICTAIRTVTGGTCDNQVTLDDNGG